MRQRNDRVASLEAELERRLKELEQREAALKKIADAVMKNRPAAAVPQPDDGHQARLQEIEARESALKRIADVVERRRAEIDVTVREVEERASTAEARAAELQEQVAQLSASTGRVAELEAEVAQLRAELDAAQAAPPPAPAAQPQRRGLFGRRARVEQPPPEVQPPSLLPPPAHAAEPEPEEEPEPTPVQHPPAPTFDGRPTLPQLEHVAAEADRNGRPEAQEWLVYAGLLREHAWMDGTIPPQFDDILRDVFGATF